MNISINKNVYSKSSKGSFKRGKFESIKKSKLGSFRKSKYESFKKSKIGLCTPRYLPKFRPMIVGGSLDLRSLWGSLDLRDLLTRNFAHK